MGGGHYYAFVRPKVGAPALVQQQRDEFDVEHTAGAAPDSIPPVLVSVDTDDDLRDPQVLWGTEVLDPLRKHYVVCDLSGCTTHF